MGSTPRIVLAADMTHYVPEACATFCRVRQPLGELSNMHAGFPFRLDDIEIRSSEALYQALRYPEHPALQQEILLSASPMASKHRAYADDAIHYTRPDWLQGENVQAMAGCVWAKYLAYREQLQRLLDSTSGREIVEISSRDPFWGAVPTDTPQGPRLIGHNQLGRLWMMLRDQSPRAAGGVTLHLLGRKIPVEQAHITPLSTPLLC